MKRCVRALAEAGDGNFDGLCEQLIQEEQRKGHTVVAKQLERAYQETRKRKKPVSMPQVVSLFCARSGIAPAWF
ncbi:MAG: hypothetical protein JJU05_14755 [Verrucomicrobia bacterium]|nr:hypothetical protein [Verrucomicrobiota bacterium]MCH8528039.1 hypothetical protein [Kiritimatiellia bacterium]